jgi:hypothetical protein
MWKIEQCIRYLPRLNLLISYSVGGPDPVSMPPLCHKMLSHMQLLSTGPLHVSAPKCAIACCTANSYQRCACEHPFWPISNPIYDSHRAFFVVIEPPQLPMLLNGWQQLSRVLQPCGGLQKAKGMR